VRTSSSLAARSISGVALAGELAIGPVGPLESGAGDLDDDGTEELLIRAQDRVWVLDLVCQVGCAIRERARVDFPAAEPGAPLVVHANDDPIADLYLGGQVAHGRPDGGFDPAIGSGKLLGALSLLEGGAETLLVTPFGLRSIQRPDEVIAASYIWQSALVGDFNADGATDVAGTLADLPGIEVLVGDGSGGFHSFLRSTLAPVRRLVGGDFDGDHFEDLAFLQGEELWVLFGDPQAAPDQAERMASLPGARSLHAGRPAVWEDLTGLVVLGGAAGQELLFEVHGSTARRMSTVLNLEPIPAVDPATTTRAIPAAVAVGRFEGAELGLASLTVDRQLWLTPSLGGASARSGPRLEVGCSRGDLARLIAADLTPAPGEELVASFLGEGAGPPALLELGGVCRTLPVEGRVARLDRGDVDGDGVDDLLFTTRDLQQSSVSILRSTEGFERAEVLPGAIGAAAIEISPRLGKAIALLYPGETRIFRLTAAAVDGSALAWSGLTPTAGGHALLSLDADGDRLEDLVVLTERSMQVLRHRPCLPTDSGPCAEGR
jgi:hypothetical protein